MMERPGRRGAAEPGGVMDSEEQWLKAMADQYLVHTKCRPIYFHRIKRAKSAECPFCYGTRETLAHFASVCLKFRIARTAAHNQVRKRISSLLVKLLQDRWELHEETPIAKTGLRLSRVSVT